MSDSRPQGSADRQRTLSRRADAECDRFEAAWKAGRRPHIEDHLAAVPEPERAALLCELIPLEIDYRRLAGDKVQPAEFLRRFPTLDSAWVAAAVAEAMAPATHLPGPAAQPGLLGKFRLLDQLGQGG